MSEQAPEPKAATDQDAPIQFETAEPAGTATPAAMTCSSCKQSLVEQYHEASGKTFCSACRERLTAALAGTGGRERFILAFVYGGMAAGLGALLWWGVRAVTGWEIGLVAILVGFLVGFAVKAGSQGRGGRRYQILAVCLTYMGVALNYVPDILKGITQAGEAKPAQTAPTESAARPTPAAATATAPASAPSSSATGKSVGLFQLLLFLGLVLALALAAPFLAGVQNIIGILIIGFALWEAWKINRQTQLIWSGPFRIQPASADPAGPVTST